MGKTSSLFGKEIADKWLILGMVSVGIFMGTLDASIVNISLPKISSYFEAPLGGMVEWVVIAYLLVIAGTLLTLGRLSDMVGRKSVWMCGLAVFTLGSALCGAAPSLPFLVISRAFQGLGGAMNMSVSTAMITSAFPAGERGRALGLVGAVVAIGISAGPTLGGFITQAISWRWIFYINVPIGIIGFIAAIRLLSEPVRIKAARERFDPVGAALLSIGVTLLMVALSSLREAAGISTTTIGIFTAAVVVLTVFVLVERRAVHPIVDLSIFRNRVFSSALASSFLSFLALFAVVVLMPFFLENLLLYEPGRAGLVMTAVPITISLVAPVSGWLSDRFGSQVLSSLGLAVASAGLFFLGSLNHHSSLFGIIWPLVVTGLGQGLFQAPNNNAIMSSVPPNRIGIASGFLATVRVLGQGFSVALAGAIFNSLGGARAAVLLLREHNPHASPLLQNTFIHAFHIALLTSVAIAGIGVFTALVRGRSRQPAKT